MRLAGKTALVTGSTQGIGLAIAEGLRHEGAELLVHGRSRKRTAEIAGRLGGRAVVADLSSASGVDELIRHVTAIAPRLHVLVNNAGVETGAPVATLTPDVLEQTMQVNFIAPAMILNGLLPLLTNAGTASVINVGSIHSSVPVHGNTAYSASKAALAMLTRTAAIELARDGIRVNTLTPGAIRTEHNRELIDEIGARQFEDWIPAGRLGMPHDIVGPAVFLASDESAYMTGADLVVDGAYIHHLVRYRATSHS